MFRGLSLWLIFIDHIPEVYLNRITPKNFGFSDAAEILVFLSGVASGMVYTPIARQSGLRIALQRAIRRGFEIYFAQLFTIALLLLTASLLAIWQPDLLHHANVAVFFADPFEAAWQAVTMRYSPVNLDPLLLMITRVGQGVPLMQPDNLGLAAAAVLVLGAFVWQEKRAAEPIIPLSMFRVPTVTICCLALFLCFFQLIATSLVDHDSMWSAKHFIGGHPGSPAPCT